MKPVNSQVKLPRLLLGVLRVRTDCGWFFRLLQVEALGLDEALLHSARSVQDRVRKRCYVRMNSFQVP
jgi:hypothetical protein